MCFADFYTRCQELSPKVSRAHLLPIIKEITGIENIQCRYVDFDPEIIRGMIIQPSNPDDPVIKQLGLSHVLQQHKNAHVILLARDQDDDWKRFVSVKEVMHLFDKGEELTDTALDFDCLVNDLVGLYYKNATITNAAISSENLCVLRAMAALCPEHARLDFEQRRNNGLIDDAGIAMKLGVPEVVASHYFKPEYAASIAAITANPLRVVSNNRT